MPGKNISLLTIPPGVVRNSTRYGTGARWYDASQIRWRNDIMVPIGGWEKIITFTGGGTEPIRKMYTWRDDLQSPWLAAGAADALYAANYDGLDYTQYVITPATLGYNPGGLVGFGRGAFGSGPFGLDNVGIGIELTGSWSMDNFGRLLVAVHSQDGRLVSWDPLTPATVSAPVTNAPVGNYIVIATDEEHLMVMGGDGNPRRVQWCSRREINTWTAAESNSAGGFDLQSNGSIIAAFKVQGGILVITDADNHLIEYVGPPDYYGRRKISDEGGILGRYSGISALGGALWMDHTNLWYYTGGAIKKFPCDVQSELFSNGELSPANVHFGINEESQEVWISYPFLGSTEPNRYVALSYNENLYWTMGKGFTRTAWVNPVWQTKPLGANGLDVYQHEVGLLADGESRYSDIYAETGAFDISDGDNNMFVDRVYHDNCQEAPGPIGEVDAYDLTFFLQQAPGALKRQYGPILLTNQKGFTTTRFRSRQMYVRLGQTKDSYWRLGKLRFRVRPMGAR